MSTNMGNKIRSLRKAEGLTLEGLANQVGAGKSYLWELENKGVGNPSAERLTKIAEILKVTPEYLLDDNLQQVEPEIEDEAFFRQYRRLNKRTKEQLRKIMETLAESDQS